MSDERPAKRSRITQACEPCRRKKSRCPGEKPMCSHCTRLKQKCFYSDEAYRNNGSPVAVSQASTPQHQILEKPGPPASETTLASFLTFHLERLRNVETQLAEVVSNQVSLTRISSRHVSISASPQFQDAEAATYQKRSGQVNVTLPSQDVIANCGDMYLQYCDCQPLPLFHRGTFVRTLASRDTELIFAILALTLRFTFDSNSRFGMDDYLEASRVATMQKVSDGKVELSTLQTLCLLSLVDFTNGNTQRSNMHGTLAISMAYDAGFASEPVQSVPEIELEERRRCFWSLMLLKRLLGAGFGVLDLTDKESFPWYPESTGKPTLPDPALTGNPSRHFIVQRGILSCAIQLSDIWFKSTKYARRRGQPGKLPPWSPQSEYGVIITQQMESETRMPQTHRFKPAEFSKKSVDELQANRDYWGPWIFVQFLYHTNLCLLNHPLLMSLRLKNFNSEMPEIFLQSTLDLIASHASWITHLIEMLEAKSFKVTDPFLAHCAAIVATIYLQESFVEDDREEKMEEFSKCLRFVRGFREWPHVNRMADKLEHLRETVSSAYGIDPNRGLLVDLGQFWEILEYPSSSKVSGAGSSLFGPSLQQGLRPTTSEMGHTTPLPQPTRVHAQDFTGSRSMIAVEDQPLYVYSNDELAVLAESFFPRSELDGAVTDWWNTGNL